MNAEFFGFGVKMIADLPQIRHGFGIRHIDHQTVGQNGVAIDYLKISVGDRFAVDLQIENAVFERQNRAHS